MPIDFRNYAVVKECKGNQANKIYVVEEKATRQPMILKLIKIYDLDKQLREIEVHRRLNYKFVIKMIDYDISKTHIILLIEYAKYGDLFGILPKLREIPEARLLKFYFQFVQAIDYLHSEGFVHRDIKPENILITRKFSPRLADFGTSAKTDFVKNTFCGTYEYMAPEIYLRQKQTEKVDIWALGILLFEMTHQFTPFKKRSVNEVKKILAEQQVEFKRDVNPLVRSFILSILRFDPAERPSTKELLAHPLFDGVRDEEPKQLDAPEEGLSPKHVATLHKFYPKQGVAQSYGGPALSESHFARKELACSKPELPQDKLAPGPKAPLKKLPSSQHFHTAKAGSSRPELDALKTKGKNELDPVPGSQSLKNGPKGDSSPFREGKPRALHKDPATHKAIVSSLYKIKSMFDEYREESHARPAKPAKAKPGNTGKAAPDPRANSNSYQSQSSFSSNIFKNLFTKISKKATSNAELRDPTELSAQRPKQALAASLQKKPVVSLMSLDGSRKFNRSLLKKQSGQCLPGAGKHLNVALSIQDIN